MSLKYNVQMFIWQISWKKIRRFIFFFPWFYNRHFYIVTRSARRAGQKQGKCITLISQLF